MTSIIKKRINLTVNILTLLHVFTDRITDRVIPKDQCGFRAVKCNRYLSTHLQIELFIPSIRKNMIKYS